MGKKSGVKFAKMTKVVKSTKNVAKLANLRLNGFAKGSAPLGAVCSRRQKINVPPWEIYGSLRASAGRAFSLGTYLISSLASATHLPSAYLVGTL